MSEGGKQRSGIKGDGLRRFAFFCFLMPVFCSLSACGFRPIYASRAGTSVAAELNDVAIDTIPDRHGQILRNDLIDSMYAAGRPQNPAYRLAVVLHPSEENLGILQNAVSTVTELTMDAQYTLADDKGKVLVKGVAHSVSSFNQIPAEYGSLAAEEDAYQRTLNDVGEQIVNRLSLYFSELPASPAQPAKSP